MPESEAFRRLASNSLATDAAVSFTQRQCCSSKLNLSAAGAGHEEKIRRDGTDRVYRTATHALRRETENDNMKTSGILGLVVLAMLAANGCATADAGSGHDSTNVLTALRARSDAFQAAEHALDATGSAAFYADDAIIQPAGAPQIQGRQAIGALYRYFFTTLNVKELTGTPTTLTVASAGDLAYEAGINRIVFNTATGEMLDAGKYLLVWKRIHGGWYVTALSFSSDAAPPAAPK